MRVEEQARWKGRAATSPDREMIPEAESLTMTNSNIKCRVREWESLSEFRSDPIPNLRSLARRGGYFAAFFFFPRARRSVFFRRLARFLALSLPLLFPISLNLRPLVAPDQFVGGFSAGSKLFRRFPNPRFGIRYRKFRSLNVKSLDATRFCFPRDPI